MKQLVLLGAGYAHLHLLRALAPLARKGLLPFAVTLVTPQAQHFHAGALPSLLAGKRDQAGCSIDLQPWLQACGARHVSARALQLDANAQSLRLQGSSGDFDLAYDTLSVAAQPGLDRATVQAQLPGAREHAMFLWPTDAFLPLWSKLLALADERPLRIAVIGGDAIACEVAMAIKSRLPHCAVSLVSGGLGPLGDQPEALRRTVGVALRNLGVSVLPLPCTAIEADHLVLDQHTRLACDAPLLALAPQAPRWLQGSGLSLDEHGWVHTNALQQSSSHGRVFVSADLASEGSMTRDWALAHLCAPALTRNVLAHLQGQTLRPWTAPPAAWRWVACGPHRAVLTRGSWASHGWWASLWRNWRESRFLAAHRRP